MLKRFSHFFACLLLVLMPIQALASANMLVCNALMQSQMNQQDEVKIEAQSARDMPCHQTVNTTQTKNSNETPCKDTCALMCANMFFVSAMPTHTQLSFALNVLQKCDFDHISYASITQPSLQRPPISFI